MAESEKITDMHVQQRVNVWVDADSRLRETWESGIFLSCSGKPL